MHAAHPQSKVFTYAVAAVVIVAGVMIGVQVTKGTPTYPINVVYSSAPGLFTGAAVDVLGVKVGSRDQRAERRRHGPRHARRGPGAPKSRPLPSRRSSRPSCSARPTSTSTRATRAGRYLPSNATIAEDHTAVPVSTDEVLKELQRTLNALNPHAVGSLVSNLATDLDGQGQNLNKLIASAAGTVQLLAEKGNDLGQLNGTLAQLTGTLDSDTAQIEQLIEQYDTVSTTVAQHSGQLNDAITQLSQASAGLVQLLVPNLQPLEADVGTVTTVGRTLDRNLANVDEILQNGNNLFQGAQRAYDPNYNWLDLNLQLAPGVTGAYLAGLLRDRLAGICRRLAANHASGLSADGARHAHRLRQPVVGLLRLPRQRHPDDHQHADGGEPARPRRSRCCSRGSSRSRTRRRAPAPTSTTPAAGSNAPKSSGPSPPPRRRCRRRPRRRRSRATCSLSSSGASRAPARRPRARARRPSRAARAAGSVACCPTRSRPRAERRRSPARPRRRRADVATNQAPSLTAPAAGLLPPLPQDQGQGHGSHGHHQSPGLLSQWAHDVASWF